MNENATYYTDLITRYFSGEIAEEDLRVLSGWLKADPENEKIFREYHKTWMLVEKHKVNSTIDPKQEWNTLQERISTPWTTDESSEIITLNSRNNNIRSSFYTSWRAAAAVAVLLVSTILMYLYFTKPAEIIVTAQDSNIEQLLPDGSVVSLQAGSQLTYPAKFRSGKRNVELRGEAYFKVAHDKSKPFIVASGDARVEVLGTQFNVNTHSSSGKMEVVLTTGKVSVYFKEKPESNVMLLPGEKAELITEQEQISKTTNSDPNYMAWKTRVLAFNNSSLGQVVNTLQNVYQKPITLADKQLSDCRVTASFNNQSLESVLEVIKQTLDLQVKQDANGIEIGGNGCR
jgi:ferric-dicitrate binding protein FerR (iron transport regulator)